MKRTFLYVCLLMVSLSLSAQDGNGYLTGSFENTTHYYVEDKQTGALYREDPFGSNNYLKLDYHKGKFSAGMQMEGYLPLTVGYPNELTGVNLSNLYATWRDDTFSITAGTFDEQFGSGLLFRTWEDRMLGLNKAVVGARFTWNYEDILSFKALWGLPRYGMGIFTNNTSRANTLTNTNTQVRGADLSFSISSLAGWDATYLALEGSVLNRCETGLNADLLAEGGKSSTTGWSGRVNFEKSGFFLKAEYVDAGDKYYQTPVSSDVFYLKKKGNAQLVELGYNGRGLGVTLTGRRLEYMNLDIISGDGSSSNMMNYAPAMCTQYTYMLTTMHPYSAQLYYLTGAFSNSGEMGGQIDAFYNFRRGTALGGKRGMKVHANFSTYYAIAQEGTFNPGNLLFRDFSFDVEKQFSKEFKMMLLYSHQNYNDSYGADPSDVFIQNIVVADLLYKFTSKFSTRLELQYLATRQDKGDWMAALLEVNFAPHWSVFASDMFNHGSTKIHYYNAGVSYAKSRTRIAVGYGRYKEGKLCSGGVCRNIPAYTGANFSITTSF